MQSEMQSFSQVLPLGRITKPFSFSEEQQTLLQDLCSVCKVLSILSHQLPCFIVSAKTAEETIDQLCDLNIHYIQSLLGKGMSFSHEAQSLVLEKENQMSVKTHLGKQN